MASIDCHPNFSAARSRCRPGDQDVGELPILVAVVPEHVDRILQADFLHRVGKLIDHLLVETTMALADLDVADEDGLDVDHRFTS